MILYDLECFEKVASYYIPKLTEHLTVALKYQYFVLPLYQGSVITITIPEHKSA